MKQTFIYILLMLLPMTASAFTGTAEIGELKYSIVTKGKTASVVGLASGKNPTDINIPSTIEYDGVICDVSSIHDRAFYEKDFLISSMLLSK